MPLPPSKPWDAAAAIVPYRSSGKKWHRLLLLGSLSMASGLVVENPCCLSVLHVPAGFGPDILTLDPPLKGVQLVTVEPEDACSEITTKVAGKVALIKRGNCNFTEKILQAQKAAAVAAVVYDSYDKERWGTIMSGVEDEVDRVTIPSVFVSHSTGTTLKNHTEENEEVLITLNGTGHVKPKTKQIGPIETLATYVVVSLVLLSFSGCCGLLLALCVTCYQRAFRSRALRSLKIQTFRKPVHTAPLIAASSNSSDMMMEVKGSTAAAASSSVNTTPVAAAAVQRKEQATTATKAAAKESAWEEQDRCLCAICLDDYQDGDTLRLLPCGHSFHDVCIKPWLMEKSEACPMCKRNVFRYNLLGDTNSTNQAAVALDATTLDDIGLFLMNNVSFFAMMITAVITSATVLGSMALMRP